MVRHPVTRDAFTRIRRAVGVLLLVASPLVAQPDGDTLEIYAVHGSEAELEVVEQLRSVVARHDLRNWEVAPVVRIDETQIPHSHPVLTIHTRHRDDPDGLLAVYLHEQFHWWINERSEAQDAVITELRATWPEVPVGDGEGARSEYSTYLHLVVCHLEYQAVSALLGEARAREKLRENRHYRWIYETVLDDPRVGEILARHGLVLS